MRVVNLGPFDTWWYGYKLLKAVQQRDLSKAAYIAAVRFMDPGVMNFHDPFYNHGETVLGYSIWTKNPQMAEMLLGYGVDPNEPVLDNGISPLRYARIMESQRIVELLEASGASQEFQQRKYCTSWLYRLTPWLSGTFIVLYCVAALVIWGLFNLVKWLVHLR
jgi:hypothetical protein